MIYEEMVRYDRIGAVRGYRQYLRLTHIIILIEGIAVFRHVPGWWRFGVGNRADANVHRVHNRGVGRNLLTQCDLHVGRCGCLVWLLLLL